MSVPARTDRSTVIAHHLVLSGYATWLSNDPRGSGSTEVRKPELRPLGPAHFGRKADRPSRIELRTFHRAAEPKLEHCVAWFDAAAREVIAGAVERVVRHPGYTCYAFCSCASTGHLMVRVHRDPGRTMWQLVADASRAALHAAGIFAADHPVRSDRPYVELKSTVAAVEGGVEHIERNPGKEGWPRQHHACVTPYDGWPSRRP